MNRTILSSEKGFGLIEVMITVLVMSTVLISILMANTAMSQASDGVHERLFAIQDANQVIERSAMPRRQEHFPVMLRRFTPTEAQWRVLIR